MEAVKSLVIRHIDLNSLFTCDQANSDEDDHKGTLLALRNALEKQVQTWWDICTMEQYIKE